MMPMVPPPPTLAMKVKKTPVHRESMRADSSKETQRRQMRSSRRSTITEESSRVASHTQVVEQRSFSESFTTKRTRATLNTADTFASTATKRHPVSVASTRSEISDNIQATSYASANAKKAVLQSDQKMSTSTDVESSMPTIIDRDAALQSIPSGRYMSSISTIDGGNDNAEEEKKNHNDGQHFPGISENPTKEDGDEMAEMMANLLWANEHSSNAFGSLAERATIIKSINWLSRHVPQCVLSDLNGEILQLTKSALDMKKSLKSKSDDNYTDGKLASIMESLNVKPPMEMPYATEYKAALLFIDMSGFTKISQELDVESLSKAINSYFQAIVDEVTSHGGDILKFAGDAIFAEWRAEDPSAINAGCGDSSTASSSKSGSSGNLNGNSGSFRNSSSRNDRGKNTSAKSRRVSRRSTMGMGTNTSSLSSKRIPPTKGLHRSKSATKTRRSKSASKKQQYSSSSKGNGLTLEECVHTAAVCGAMVVRKCSDYPIYAKTISGLQGELVAKLNVHCGLGVGDMVGVHVGNDYNRREYLVFGDPIDQVAEACDSAKLGEIRASTEALKYLNRTQNPKSIVKCEHRADKSAIIASGKRMFFSKRMRTTWTLDGKIRKPVTIIPSQNKCTIPFDMLDTMSLKFLQKLLSFYVHPVVVAEEAIGDSSVDEDDKHASHSSLVIEANLRNRRSSSGSAIAIAAAAARRRSSSLRGSLTLRGSLNSSTFRQSSTSSSSDNFRNKVSSAHERLRSEAELRSVFTIFIMPKIETRLTDDPKKNRKTYKLLNDMMNIVTSILDNYKGHLRQYIVDDKGVVLIATFGLRGSTFPNMVSERALPTCRLIHSTLTNELGVDNQIGATLGKVYCGVVGGVDRHEFAVLGPSVNLAARLMAQKNHPGVLVDDLVRSKARKFNFIAFPPVKAKGYTDLVPVFKPLTAKETKWGKANMQFVGRKDEMEQVCNIALEMAQEECPSRIFFVWGESGAGKSTFAVHTIAKVHKALASARRSSIITRNVCSDGDNLVPFSLFRSIFRDVLSEKPMGEDGSFGSGGTGSYRDRDWDSVSLSSLSTAQSQKTSVIGRLREICEEIDAPSGFLEIVGHHLLGNSRLKMSSVEKAPELADIVSFMAQVFIRSTSHAEVVVLALDDVQWMDNLSWKVLQSIFENGLNVLIVCGSRPFESQSLTMDDDFWDMLREESRKEGRYDEILLGPLAKNEVRELASLTLKCDPDEIMDKFIDDIHMHSGGMPYYASEILQNCVRNKLFRRFDNNMIGWRPQRRNSQEGLQFSNLNELLLQRVDNLDDMTRKVLHFASVLGESFKIREMVEISEHILNIPQKDKEDHFYAIQDALSAAVEDGILYEIVLDEESVDEERNKIKSMLISVDSKEDFEDETENRRVYSFCHSTWRRLILSLLLDSWKRDIHKHAAMAIEARSPDANSRDYRTKVKLFQHWKSSENTVKAAELALNIGQSYKMLGLNLHSIKVYDDALNMWRKVQPDEEEDLIAGISPDVLDSLDEENLILMIKLLTMFGQALGTAYMEKRSARAFEDALAILRFAPVSAEITDRAFVFPIYSGLFFLLKYGNLVDPSEQPSYEVDLVANFVNETKKHGDPVHYGRALAMQGETYHRQGKYEEAIQSHIELKRVYDVEKHHALVVASYASDRCAQNFGLSANCFMRLGRVDEALELVDYIITYLMPKMNLKNVHNSIVTIYPAIWILKDNNRAERALEIFLKFVLEPFREYFGEDGKTPFLPTFRGIETLFGIVFYMEGTADSLDERYFEWALDLSNLEWKMSIDIAIGAIARSPMSINAEICLRLSKLTDDPEKRMKLIENGMKLAKQAISGCDGSDGSSKLLTTYCQIKPVYDELEKLTTNQS